jgi:hypothetical protein
MSVVFTALQVLISQKPLTVVPGILRIFHLQPADSVLEEYGDGPIVGMCRNSSGRPRHQGLTLYRRVMDNTDCKQRVRNTIDGTV